MQALLNLREDPVILNGALHASFFQDGQPPAKQAGPTGIADSASAQCKDKSRAAEAPRIQCPDRWALLAGTAECTRKPSPPEWASQAPSSLDGAPPAKHSRSADSGNVELDAKTRDMLQKLSELSNSLVHDSKEDDEIFRARHRESLD